jgi:hypothetical protein
MTPVIATTKKRSPGVGQQPLGSSSQFRCRIIDSVAPSGLARAASAECRNLRSIEWLCNVDQFWRNISSIIVLWGLPKVSDMHCALRN